MNTYERIMMEISEYKTTDRPGWWRTGEWMRIFHSIRTGLYSGEITLAEYGALMGELGVD